MKERRKERKKDTQTWNKNQNQNTLVSISLYFHSHFYPTEDVYLQKKKFLPTNENDFLHLTSKVSFLHNSQKH